MESTSINLKGPASDLPLMTSSHVYWEESFGLQDSANTDARGALLGCESRAVDHALYS